MAGYSGTPLAKKLGIKEGARVLCMNAPKTFAIEAMPAGATMSAAIRKDADVAIVFVKERARLVEQFETAVARSTKRSSVWIAWPKKASKIDTDVTEDVLREDLLPTGWVDTKVCAIDDAWSGLRFVLRLENR